MYVLSKEQKISNLQERKVMILKKIQNLRKEYDSLEEKILRINKSENQKPTQKVESDKEETFLFD